MPKEQPIEAAFVLTGARAGKTVVLGKLYSFKDGYMRVLSKDVDSMRGPLKRFYAAALVRDAEKAPLAVEAAIKQHNQAVEDAAESNKSE